LSEQEFPIEDIFTLADTVGRCFLFEQCEPDEAFSREDISKQQQMIGMIAEEFMRKKVLPRSDEIYAKDWNVTRELLLEAGELGLLSIDIPEKHGGLGLDKVSSAYIGEQIGLMPSFGASLGAHTSIGTLPIVYFGTDEQKTSYLPKLASGEMIAAYALTETGSGSDALAAKTKATLSEDGKYYILNGQKMWISNGGFADLFTIFAKIDGDKFTAFIVERDFGVVSGKEEPKLGLDGSSTTALILDNVRVPVENVLGQIGKGHVIAFNILNLGRLKLGTRNLGSAKNSLNQAINYARDRYQFSRPIASFGLIKQKLAEMAIRCYVGDALVYRTLGMVDRSLKSVDHDDRTQTLKAIEHYAVECSIIKVWTSEALALVVDEMVQIYGGYGFSKEFPAERAYRDARITRIYEGTNEINRLIIPTRLLKNAAKGNWQIEEIANTILDEVFSSVEEFSSEPEGLPYVKQTLERAKRTAILLLAAFTRRYGQEISEAQEALGLLADTLIDVYAIECAWLRTAKWSTRNGEKESELVIDIARVYTSEAAERIAVNARKLLIAVEGSDQEWSAIGKLSPHRPIEAIQARRRIADSIIAVGRYLW
jgi:alkylation response protein AidB-like acyl-CoA dehydrogenase